MSNWWKKSLSLLLSLVMVLGLMPAGLTVRAAEEVDPEKDLNKANGIIWLTKNKEGNNVSDEFSSMVVNDLMLDDMVREALGIEDETTKVYYDGVDVGDIWSLLRNQDTIEELVEEMKASISNQYPVMFTVGNAEKVIAFRNLQAAELIVGDNNKIYIEHTGAPADAEELEDLVTEALDAAKVSVSHTGTVVATGIKQEVINAGSPAIRYEGTDIVLSDRQTFESLVAKWPTISASPDLDTKKAGTVTVTVYAAEYKKNQDEQFKKTVTVDVYMRDQNRASITVKALALHNGSEKQDKELENYEYTCQAYVGSDLDSQMLAPVLENYTHIGWRDQEPSQVTGDATYYAVMKPRTDNNENGLADQNEQFTVTYISVSGNDVNVIAEHTVNYGSDTPNAAKPEAPEGKKYIWKVYDEETGAGVGPWQAKVYDKVTYVAVLLEGPSVTGTFKMRDTVYQPVELGTFLANHDLEDGYNVEDPRWDLIQAEGFECTGWYYVDPNHKDAQDLNHDGIKEEVSFEMDKDLVYTANGEVKLFYEFYTIKEGAQYADGTVNNPLYIYEFVDADVDAPMEMNSQITSAQEPDYIGSLGRYQKFVKWNYQDVDKNKNDYIHYYKATAEFETLVSKIAFSGSISDIIEFKLWRVVDTKLVDGALWYTWEDNYSKQYQSYIKISDMTEDQNFIYGTDTLIEVSPIWEINGDQKTMKYYVDEVSVDGTLVDGAWDTDKVFNNTVTSSASSEGTAGVTLDVKYEPISYETQKPGQNFDVKLPAGSTYTMEAVYEAVMRNESIAYKGNEDKITVKYLARSGGKVQVSLQKLYDILSTEGLGSLLDGLTDTLEKAYGEHELKELWLNVDGSDYPQVMATRELTTANSVKEMTAQEVTDAHFMQAYKDERLTNLEDIYKVLGELNATLKEKAVHQFGYIAPGESEVTEQVKITYIDNKINITANASIIITDSRKETWFEFADKENKALSVVYNDSVVQKVLSHVVLKAKNDLGEEIVLSEKELVTMDGNSVKDYNNANAGDYTVKVVFKGDDTYKPAISESFALTITKVQPTVTVKELITVEKGNEYYSEAMAKVEPNAPIMQIVAGVSADEFKLDKDFKLADDKLVIDAWVKLPAMYIDLLNGMKFSDVNAALPDEFIEVGKYYEKEQLKEVLEAYAEDTTAPGAAQIQQILDMMDKIPEKILNRLGMNDLNYTLRIRLDALEKKVYPTDAGFYLNYAATLSTFMDMAGQEDPNYEVSDDYGFIVISPMLPIPNRGGVQLYDGEVSNAQNVFVYKYNGEKIVRDLEVAVNGDKLEGETPFYYGLSTRFEPTTEAPATPGVYFAGYNYTTDDVYNKDTQEYEVRLLGSDSAIIIIKQREVDLEIKGGTYEYDGENHIAEVIVTDENGTVIDEKGVTVVSGTVNVNTNGTNVTANDFYGTVNVDFPDALQNKWDEYCNKIWGQDAKDKFAPSDVISFLKECGDAAEDAVNKAIEEFKSLAIDETVSAALDKINGNQDKVDVSSDNLVNKAERIQDMMQGGKAYYDKLIEQLEPLAAYDDNVWITFYDLATESDKLDYSKTGAYLYLGVTTDPDLTVGAGKALVIIHSADDYIMYDTHVPYDGKPHDIYVIDETKRGDVTAVLYPAEDGVIAINREKKEVHIQVDDELAEVICDALNLLCETDLNVDSDVYVGTVYTKTKDVADELTKKIMNFVKTRAVAEITADYPQAGEPLEKALAMLEVKLESISAELFVKLQDLDGMENDTKIVISDLFSFDLGTYEVTTFDFNVNEINIQLDGDAFKALKTALEKKGYQLNEGSDGYVVTGYEKFEDAAAVITESVFDEITAKVNAAFDKTSYDTPEKLETALEVLENKILGWKDRFSAKLQQVDGLNNYTRIVINGELPVEVGTYDFIGFDYDVAATRGQLVIEPIYILVEDEDASKYVGEDDPELTATVTYYSYEGIAPGAVEKKEITELPAGVTEADLVSYVVSREAGEEIGKYDMTVVATLLNNSGNYVLAERTEDGQDFEIYPEIGTMGLGEWKMDLDSVVYLQYYPKLEGFSESFDFSDENRAGVVIWIGDKAPANRNQLMVGEDNTMVIKGWEKNEENDEWFIRTHEIYAKNLGDMVYIRPYVIDREGNYVYMDAAPYYSPKLFAYDVMNGGPSQAIGKKNVCAALLQYGASAQEYFNYETENLVTEIPVIYLKDENGKTVVDENGTPVNKFRYLKWQDYESAMVYKDDYIDDYDLTNAKALKGTLESDADSTKEYVTYEDSTLNLAGAIRFHAGFKIDGNEIAWEDISKAEVLFWNERDLEEIIAAENSLEYEYHNYSFKYDLEKATGTEEFYVGDYIAQSGHIVAKYLGETVFFTCRIEENDGTVHNSGVAYYSPEGFAKDYIQNGKEDREDAVCERIVVYSEMAKQWFLKDNQ